jgi:hypothetical protein
MSDDLHTQALEALQRTSAHPSDPRVRITRNPADLVAIHCEGVSAVIWKRELPQAVKDAVANMNTVPFPNECRALSVDFTGKSHVAKGRESPELIAQLPPPVKEDMLNLSKVFLQAVNGNSGSLRENVSYQNPADPGLPCTGGARMPHIDGFDIRLNTIYSTNEKMGTEWYPVEKDRRDKLRKEFAAAADSEAVKRKYGLQQISTGEVTIFKGHGNRFHGNDVEETSDQFLHSEPLPRPGVFRLGYLIGV